MNNIYQNYQQENHNSFNSAFYPNYNSNNSFNPGLNVCYNYFLNQLYLQQYQQFIDTIKSNHQQNASIEAKEEHTTLFETTNKRLLTQLSTKSNISNVINLLGKQRERSIKNNKLVYVHSRKALVNRKKVFYSFYLVYE